MSQQLVLDIGQYSDKGRKLLNQDSLHFYFPSEPLLSAKGVAFAIADGISSSNVSQEASKTAVSGFLDDYFSTSEAWSVKRAGECVINALNSWLYARTRQSEFKYTIEKGYVCTFSCLIIKGATAHIFHIGDSQVLCIRNKQVKTITSAHRTQVSSQESYLARAMGMNHRIDIDYHAFKIEPSDIYILTTDGVHESLTDDAFINISSDTTLTADEKARLLVEKAYEQGSGDNLTAQLIEVKTLPSKSTIDMYEALATLPFPPKLEARMEFDGFTIERQLYTSSRSHVFLATDNASKEQVVIKTLATELQQDSDHQERFLLEEWIARRVKSAHVLKPCNITRARHFFYVATEYIEGKTLAQWMIDNPNPNLDEVRDIIEQIARGLNALHKLEMLHQDLRPENIMIDKTGTIKIIDFGSVSVAGIEEMTSGNIYQEILGTAQFTAPEYFLGEFGTAQSDQFSLAVIAYQMLSGELPYGTKVAKTHSRAAQKRLRYKSLLNDESAIPAFVDYTLKKALHVDPMKRYSELSEFVFDLRKPSQHFLSQGKLPLIQRNPIMFWQAVSAILFLIILILLYK